MTPFEEFLLTFASLALGIVAAFVLWAVVQVRKPLTEGDRTYLQGQVREYQSLYEMQRRRELMAVTTRMERGETHLRDVTAAYYRLTDLYNALRHHQTAVELLLLQTWPEVAPTLPVYSAADPPVLPPWPLEDEPRKS